MISSHRIPPIAILLIFIGAIQQVLHLGREKDSQHPVYIRNSPSMFSWVEELTFRRQTRIKKKSKQISTTKTVFNETDLAATKFLPTLILSKELSDASRNRILKAHNYSSFLFLQ